MQISVTQRRSFKCSVCSISPFTLAAQHVSFATELSSANMTAQYSTDLPASESGEAPSSRPAVKEVFKSYLEDKLEQNHQRFDNKSQQDKQVAMLKYRGNQKQFEHNASVEAIFDKLKAEIQPENQAVQNLLDEAKTLIKKRQKLIRIADGSADGWKVVDQYLCDDLASDSEDEKHLRKARDAASRKRRSVAPPNNASTKRPKFSSQLSEQRFFRGKHCRQPTLFALLCSYIVLGLLALLQLLPFFLCL